MNETATSDSSQNGAPWRDRRRFLGTIAAFSAVPMTGCLGGGGGEPDNSASDSANQQSGCPSLPLSYKEYQVTESPSVAFELPAEATVSSSGSANEDNSSAVFDSTAVVEDGANPLTYNIAVQSSDTPIDDVSVEDNPSYGEEVTGEYDPAVSGARVMLPPTIEYDRNLLLEGPDGPLVISITLAGFKASGVCTEAAVAVRDHLIETMRPLE